MQTYRTSEVAERVGVHPNTVRLYEKLGLIPTAVRAANGYRVFTNIHIKMFELAQVAFQIEVLQNGLRKKVVEVVKTAALGNYEQAIAQGEAYLMQLQKERLQAQEAIQLVTQLLSGASDTAPLALKRKEAADYLQISIDSLRNWEMNGLLTVKRTVNGYRVYTGEDIQRLKIIRSLRCANYSLEAILRLLSTLSRNPEADIQQTLDTPEPDGDIMSVYDHLLTSLSKAEINAGQMLAMLTSLKQDNYRS